MTVLPTVKPSEFCTLRANHTKGEYINMSSAATAGERGSELMKIKIAYQKNEEREALELARLIKHECEPDNVINEKKSERHAPFIHIYLTITSLLKSKK